jgi:hypothetical protein
MRKHDKNMIVENHHEINCIAPKLLSKQIDNDIFEQLNDHKNINSIENTEA